MKKRKFTYWEQRAEDLKNKEEELTNEEIKRLEKLYAQTLREINENIERWYIRIARNNEVSISEARKLLNKKELAEMRWTVNEYIRKGIENKVNGKWIKELENASAKAHISRYEWLKLQIKQHTQTIFTIQEQNARDLFSKVFEEVQIKTAYDIQKMTNSYTPFQAANTAAIETYLRKPWAVDGKTFSARLWDNQVRLVNTLDTKLIQGLVTGRSLDKITKDVVDVMGASKRNVYRVVRTESAYFSELARAETFKELGVNKYEIVATLDMSTSTICRSLDGKVFEMKDKQFGVTFPPFHPYCRTTTVPYFEGLNKETTRTARDVETGKTIDVEGDITYDKWYNEYVISKKRYHNILFKAKTSNGIVIIGVSDHAVDRFIGRNITALQAKDAIENPLDVLPIKTRSDGKKSQEFVGKRATVAVNPENGNIVTVYKRRKREEKKRDSEI